MTGTITLNPLTLPLHGNHLIEASAGTGKTYTLVGLYLRLILGHGENAFADGLAPDEILVLTYTRAATAELRERIRARLVDAQAALEQLEAAGDDHAAQAAIADVTDSFVHDLLEQTVHRTEALKRCRKAALEMDKAAIHTIHGFCQQALQRFAFAAGHAFDQDVETDTTALDDNISNDYWRRFIQPLPSIICKALADEKIREPGELDKAIRDAKFEAGEPGDFPPEILAQQAQLAELQQLQEAAQTALQTERTRLDKWVQEELAANHLQKAQGAQAAIKALDAFTADGTVKSQLKYFTPKGVKWKAACKNTDPPSFTCFGLIANFLDRRADTPDFPREALLQHATDWMTSEKDKRLAEQSKITFKTMVTHLARAITADGGQPLADQLFDTYPATLIDEFQDTDADQYAIFRRIYADRNPADYAWLMIGDPKQSIYGFRGADVDVYLQAKTAIDKQHTLARNYRSAAPMVAGCNQLFLNSPLERDTDAGIFGKGDVRYYAIEPNGRKDQFSVNNQPGSGITLCYPEQAGLMAKGDATDFLSEQFAARIAALLSQANDGNAVFVNEASQTPVEPGDIACLVRDWQEAGALKNALRDRGVDAVFISERSSVYETATATELFRILRALINPQDGRRVRQALACDLLAFDSHALIAQLEDEDLWLAHLQTFRELHATWQRFGILPALHQLAHRLNLPARQRDERELTNFFHLAELLQQASTALDGMEAILEYLETAIADPTNSADNNDIQLRLENEHNRVVIMTIHAAKGLEFPLVMLPFASLAQMPNKQGDANENMRLLYVALTRAAHACWIGLTPCKAGGAKVHQLETTALGRLLFGNAHTEPESMDATLDALCENNTDKLALDRTWPDTDAIYESDTSTRELTLPSLAPPRRPARWSVTSYSRIASAGSYDHFSAASERLLESDDPTTATDSTGPENVHQFHRGPDAGNLLHGLMERACKQGFDQLDADAIDRLVDERCHGSVWQDAMPLLTRWLNKIITTPLPISEPPAAFTQFDVTLAENEFWLRLDRTRLTDLEQLARELLPGERKPLPAQHINGMLKGFIDLLFCSGGRYYVLDYKSNYLGPENSAYTQDNMTQAMLAHRYELQGLIYQLALHRLLRARLPDYDPAQHLGGSLFFFIRGIDSASQGLFHLDATTRLIEQADALFDGEPLQETRA